VVGRLNYAVRDPFRSTMNLPHSRALARQFGEPLLSVLRGLTDRKSLRSTPTAVSGDFRSGKSELRSSMRFKIEIYSQSNPTEIEPVPL